MTTTVTDRDAELAVSLAAAKAHLRVNSNDLDSSIQLLLEAATEYCESETGRALRVSETLTQSYGQWPCNPVRFDRQPVQSISHVKYYNASGTLTTVSSSNYRLHKSRHAAAFLEFDADYSWPTLEYREDAVIITYLAGYGTINDVPADGADPAVLGVPAFGKAAVLLTLELLFGNFPEGMVENTTARRNDCLNKLVTGAYR